MNDTEGPPVVRAPEAADVDTTVATTPKDNVDYTTQANDQVVSPASIVKSANSEARLWYGIFLCAIVLVVASGLEINFGITSKVASHIKG